LILAVFFDSALSLPADKAFFDFAHENKLSFAVEQKMGIRR